MCSDREVAVAGAVDPDCLDRIHTALSELWAGAPDIPDLDQYLFSTALLEVVSNTLAHGNGENVKFWLTLAARTYGVEAYYRDNAEPVTICLEAELPHDDYAESGRGLAMARLSLTTLTYQRETGLNRWHLVRCYSADSPLIDDE